MNKMMRKNLTISENRILEKFGKLSLAEIPEIGHERF
jgi:hypothetical protein